MSHGSPSVIYEKRLKILKNRRNFLDRRAVMKGDNKPDHDLAEAHAIDWAISIIEGNHYFAIDLIRTEYAAKKQAQVSDLRLDSPETKEEL